MRRTALQTWWQDRRQRRHYPPEFRIPRPLWPDDVQRDYERVVATLAAVADTPTPASDDSPADDEALADAALGLWRTGRRIDSEDPDGTSRLTRQLRRHVETAWQGLNGAGITVHQHEDEPYHDGLDLRVAAREPRPGLARETVVETVAPSILRSKKVIRPGEVIVGYPERKGNGA